MTDVLTRERHGAVEVLTMNRPERLNAFTEEMGSDLMATIQELSSDESIRALVITGAGHAFCSGADRDRVAKRVASQEDSSTPAAFHRKYRRVIPKLILGLQNMDIPTIAAVPGPAVGIGCEIALACDIRLGSDAARFGEAWVNRGMIAAGGGTWLLPRIVGPGRAAELLFTGRIVEAAEAAAIGLLNTVVPAAELMPRAMALAETIAKQPPIAVKLSKINLYKGLSMDLATALELLGASQAIAVNTKDHVEAIAAWGERRAASYKGN